MKQQISPAVAIAVAVATLALIGFFAYRLTTPTPAANSGPTTEEMMSKMKGPQGQPLSVPKMKGQP